MRLILGGFVLYRHSLVLGILLAMVEEVNIARLRGETDGPASRTNPSPALCSRFAP